MFEFSFPTAPSTPSSSNLVPYSTLARKDANPSRSDRYRRRSDDPVALGTSFPVWTAQFPESLSHPERQPSAYRPAAVQLRDVCRYATHRWRWVCQERSTARSLAASIGRIKSGAQHVFPVQRACAYRFDALGTHRLPTRAGCLGETKVHSREPRVVVPP